MLRVWCLLLLVCPFLAAQTTGELRGLIADATGLPIAGALIEVKAVSTGQILSVHSDADGSFSVGAITPAQYEVTATAPGFAPGKERVTISTAAPVSVAFRLPVAAHQEILQVSSEATAIQTNSTVVGSVISQKESLDLPLNGRNFSQLGLLQAGVVPMTAGVAAHGGSRRSGHAYAANGQRPESNNFLIDGARTVNRVDGGFALRLPMDAIEEFRILAHTASAEYGGTSGSNTTVVIRSGTSQWHGTLYEYFRNDRLDARNFFAARTEPRKQNQFGGSAGAPLVRDRLFAFGWYEGFRNRQGISRGATVPTPAERSGDFSAMAAPLIDAANGTPYPGNRLPEHLINPISRSLLKYYPFGTISPSFVSSMRVAENDLDQFGAKSDWMAAQNTTASVRYGYASGFNYNPLSILGSDIPGFPVGDYLSTHLAVVSLNRVHSERTVLSLRSSFFRHDFLLEKRLSGLTPRALGFEYDPTLDSAAGAPAFLVSGYSNLGDPVIGPRDTVQNDFENGGAVAHVRGGHTLKFGGEVRRTQINAVQGLFANGSFTFTSQGATNHPFANFLLGRPTGFTQAGGDPHRALRATDTAWYAQDEWRATRHLTLNLGVRHEINPPFSETRGKLNAFVPGAQSQVFPNAPAGILVPGDPGVPETIAGVYRRGFMPRVGIAIDPTGSGLWSIRSGYAIFYDVLANGVGGPLRIATQTLPWTRTRALSGDIDFARPIADPAANFSGLGFPAPASTFTISSDLRPPYAQNWNLSIQRTAGSHNFEVRYAGTKGTRLPRFVEGNPAVFGPGATARNADRRRIYAGCADPAKPCRLGHVALLTGETNSTYHAGQVTVSRTGAVGYRLSYTFSKTLDYVSSLHLAGPAPILISGENDVAQNPFDLRAEHGPSLFDARHRFVGHFSAPLPLGVQLSGIVTASSATPFTVYDSRNVSLQAAHPPLSGVFASRPDLLRDPNSGPHRVEQWIDRGAFRRLDPALEAGRFGNAGRNIARGAAQSNLDLSLLRSFAVRESHSVQLRAECFNVLNHANLGLPVNDLASPNFGRILEAGAPRLMQLAVRYQF